MKIDSYLVTYTGRDRPTLFGGNPPLVRVAVDGEGNYSFPIWNVPNLEAPTQAAITAALTAPEPLTELAADVIHQCSVAAAVLTQEIVPDPVHQLAYNNAFAVVGSSGTLPATVDPNFTLMAQSVGMTAQQLATTASAVGSQSFALSAALATLTVSAYAATTPTALSTALATFETTLDGIVAALNRAGLTETVVAPAAIYIVGVNKT